MSHSILNLPEYFQLTPVRGKKPYTAKWQTTYIARTDIEQAIASGKATGFGLRLGTPSNGVMALDIDGTAPKALLTEIMGDEEIPVTVEFTSGKPDRSQMLFQVPMQYWDALKLKKRTIASGDTTEDLDFRWNGNQSVLPPSAHPETDGYRWIDGKSPADVEIAQLPTKLLEFWLNLIEPPKAPAEKVINTERAPSCDNSPATIPIERLLSKAHRESLSGVSSGNRDNTGIELACDLIGVQQLGSIECDYKGKNYTLTIEQNARELFAEYCSGCNPPLLDRDEDRIWNSAQHRDGTPSICDEEILKNCARGYLKEVISTDRSTDGKRKTSDDIPASVKEDRKTGGDRLLEIAQAATYFHTSDKVAYADVTIDGNRHTYAVRSKAFRLWLSGEYLDSTEKGIGSQTLQDTLSTLEAIAIFRGETREVHLRTAEYQGKIYLDLGTPDWKAIEVDVSGWRVILEPPVRFWRPDSLLPLPIPVTGGNLDELKDLLNVDGSSWTLIVTFLLFCFCPDKTYPVLVLSAHRGSGKTAAAEIIKGLIDPGKAALIKLQGDTHKLAVAATRRHLMVYDNVSHISPDQSDDLCRIATGFGFSTRTLHTTDEETTFELTRPQIITAIDALVTRDDLADRVLMAQLPEIPAEKRLPQGELNAKVEAARPRILGALLTALSQTLAQPRPTPETLPRMADYALFAIASEKALGLKEGEFMATFEESREQSRQIVIESSPVGEAIVRLMEATPLIWKGTISQLLKDLESHTDEATYRSRYFPKASNMLSRQLKRLTPDLKALGLEVREGIRSNNKETRSIVIEKVLKVSATPATSATNSPEPMPENGFRGGGYTENHPPLTRHSPESIRHKPESTEESVDSGGYLSATNHVSATNPPLAEPIHSNTLNPIVADVAGVADKNSLSSKQPNKVINSIEIPEATDDEF
ncbi:bifunctional DNA primase/polymerase [Chamaesiphon sp. VAR_48_metabat_403]|uniref:bifunctional DNA primase/polymerase n=1 Tax=Chamaesiphon sp. VAR_48_metabat_403 TaxID=2964700 RepID=UPI00286E285A|nr:bifunctional DNA primase/polymerase [Chamaesiphon sp. VAR_48_metabat_403]